MLANQVADWAGSQEHVSLFFSPAESPFPVQMRQMPSLQKAPLVGQRPNHAIRHQLQLAHPATLVINLLPESGLLVLRGLTTAWRVASLLQRASADHRRPSRELNPSRRIRNLRRCQPIALSRRSMIRAIDRSERQTRANSFSRSRSTSFHLSCEPRITQAIRQSPSIHVIRIVLKLQRGVR